MLRPPRANSRSGASSVLALLLVGGVAAAFLLILLPRLTKSSMEELRGKTHGVTTSAPMEAAAPNAPTRATLLAPTVLEETAEAVGEASPKAPGANTLVAAPAAAAEIEAATAKVSGPALKYEKHKGQAKVDPILPGQLRKEQRELSEERQKQATEEALARGEPPPPAKVRPPKGAGKGGKKAGTDNKGGGRANRGKRSTKPVPKKN